jgi:hypothetical protein
MAEGASPLDLVVRILNNQLTSLLWIDEKVLTELRSCCEFSHGLLNFKQPSSYRLRHRFE